MSVLTPLNDDEVAYLQPYLPSEVEQDSGYRDRPHVTLTYAASLDGLISISPGFRTIISRPQTKSMTHYLRSKHDAILIGSKTAIYDDPSLNCRYPGASLTNQPRPIILDTCLEWQIAGKQVIQLCTEERGKRPWVLSRAGATIPPDYPRTAVHIISIASDNDHLEWLTILQTLRARGVRSIMIEGGASIIRSLLVRPELVDSVIVTIGPTWLGTDGSSAHIAPERTASDGQYNAAHLNNVAWHQFGDDMVLCGHLLPKKTG